MALDLLNLGTVANDRTGDDWRSGGTKINNQMTELFAFKDAQQFIFIKDVSDFPVQDATTITLESNSIYIISDNVTTSLKFTVETGSVITAFNIFGPVLTYTGTGVMFTGVDASFVIMDLTVVCATAQLFDFSDTIGGTLNFIAKEFRALPCATIGTFDDFVSIQFIDCGIIATQGLDFIGSNIRVLDIDKTVFISTSASFIAVDLASAVIANPVMTSMIVIAPAGAIGISGLASSGNVPSGSVAVCRDSSFSGGMTTPLQNITSSDIRWSFRDNTGIADTVEDALISFNGSSTETVIGTQDVPVILNATWTVVTSSKFTCTTGGRCTSDAEHDLTGVPIDIAIGLLSAGGGAITVSVYLALNGSVITASKTSIDISGTSQAFISIPWQIGTIEEDDFFEVFVENNTNTTNIIGESSKLRIR